MKESSMNIDGKTLFADIGNSTIDVLLTDFDSFVFKKIPISKKSVDLSAFKKDMANIKNAYVSSVNSDGLTTLKNMLAAESPKADIKVIGKDDMVVFSEKNHYTVTNTDYLGTDLFCDIISKKNTAGEIIIDLGTASKILFIDQDSHFHGCQIFPGIATFPETLNSKAELLNDSTIIASPPLVSLKTEECISSGVINGTSSLIASMIEAIIKEYDCPECDIYITGGNADLITSTLPKFSSRKVKHDPYHVIKGLIRLVEYDYEFLEKGETK